MARLDDNEKEKASALQLAIAWNTQPKPKPAKTSGFDGLSTTKAIRDSLKVMAGFCRKDGCDGMLVLIDGLVVLSHTTP